jgi:hypothetical protein
VIFEPDITPPIECGRPFESIHSSQSADGSFSAVEVEVNRKLAYGIVRQTQHEIGERVVGKGNLGHAHPEVVRTSLTVPIIPSGAFPG